MPGIGESFDRFIVREVYIPLVTRIRRNTIQGTPVKTGYARNSWKIATNTIPVGTRADTPAGQRVQQDATFAAFRAYRLEDGNIWIYNDAPYIKGLNNGRSNQSPAGFIESAIVRGVAFQ